MVEHRTAGLLGYCQNLGDRLMLWFYILPVISAIGAIAGLSLKAGRILQKLDYVVEDVHQLKIDIREVKAEIKEHSGRIAVLETKVDMIEKKLSVG